MKFLIVFAIFAAASARIIPPSVVASTNPEVQEILASIQSPNTDPATAAALEQLLLEVLGVAKPEPIHVGPAIIDGYEPIHVGPAIIDTAPIHVGPAIIDGYEPIHVGPAIIDKEPIHVGPAIIDGYEPIHVGPAIIDKEPIHVGPAIIGNEPIHVGPAIVDNYEPISIGPAIIDPAVPSAPNSPLVQIILNRSIMKLAIAFALFAAASASIIPPSVVASTNPEVQEILAAIQNPATDPATAAALEQLLLEVLGVAKPEPIHVGPAIVDKEPIHVGPAIIDEYEPIHVGPAIVDNYEPIHVGPAIVQPAPVASSPLVQIILKVQSSSDVAIESDLSPGPTPVQVVEEAEVPEPIIVVDKPEPVPVITLPETIN
ncbi:hypothetical protein RR46_06420 [Papilio xuthus]|uniref:Cuticular protein n=1 Tax=Papilio xuthus TaxID=66420 RepID=A0A194QCW8_PAPXU|nr:hypothetical protein RR46_06420 [Papilio xuthus]